MLKYPNTPVRTVVEQVHGHEIVDHYRWLEDLNLPETKEWTRQQNEFMRETLDQLPHYEQFASRIEELYGVEQLGSVRVLKDRIFYTRSIKGLDQPVLCYRKEGEGPEQERIILDPNQESHRGTVSLSFWYPSQDGTYLAYGYTLNGEEWAPMEIMNIDTGEVLEGQIPRTRYPNVNWVGNEGFYYVRHPQAGEVPAGEENYHPKIYFHQLGTDYQSDPLIFGEELALNVTPSARLTKDQKYLILYLTEGWRRNNVYVADLQQDEIQWVPLITGLDGLMAGYVHDETMYLMTNYQSPNYRIVAFNLVEAMAKGQCTPEDWQTVVPEQEDLFLEYFAIYNNQLAFSFLRDASHGIAICQLDGSKMQEVPLPQVGSLGGVDYSEESNQAYFVFQSFVQPPMIYQLDLDSLESQVWAGGQQLEELADLEIEQHFYQSKDGTRVPMFLIHRKDLTTDAPTPTVLFGYGGFNISISPNYHPGYLSWVEAGGILAIANLRGGSEYGESWHRAGMLDQKQNVFDDFIWAGKYLIAQGYTDSEHLGIYGRSNGGLLVGATMTQAPELMRAVVCQVPLLDMVRYHKFLAGAYWIGEYGDPENPEEFEWIYDYSPYHHVQEGVEYPAVFFMTALSDTRVHPLHAMKMAALMQKDREEAEPVLLKVEAESGHGVGKPMSKMVEEQADIWAFMAWRLKL